MRKFRSRSRQEIHADDVEAHLRGSFARHLAQVLASQAAQHIAFVCVDRGLGGRHIMCRPRLHLDEAKQRALPRNQIQIARQISARPPARHNNIVLALQVQTGGTLAVDSCRQMIRLVPSLVRISAPTRRQRIQARNRPVQKLIPNLRHQSHDSPRRPSMSARIALQRNSLPAGSFTP